MHYFKRLYILFLILALNIFFFSTTKVNAKSFEINEIEISKPFQNNFNKNAVIDIGFKKAFSELINSLVKSSDFKKVDKVKLNEIRGMIDSFSIKEEKFIIIPIIIDETNNDLKIFSNNKIYDNWNKITKKYHLISYILPAEDLEDLRLIKSKYEMIEKYDFKEIIKKYFLENCIITVIFKNEKEIRILSKIITKESVVIKNNTFFELDLDNDEKIEFLINKLKIIYEDSWKEKNQINTSIKLPLIVRVDHSSSDRLIDFEKVLNQLDLVSHHSIDKLNKKYTFYKIIFNGSSSNFINTMKNKNYIFDTQKKIWILK